MNKSCIYLNIIYENHFPRLHAVQQVETYVVFLRKKFWKNIFSGFYISEYSGTNEIV